MDLHHEPGPDSFSLTSWFAVLAAEQCTEPVHIAEEVWRCPSSCPVKAHVHQTQHLLPWGHTPQGALSHEWAIAFWGIRSHWCWWEIWHWLWCLLFPDLCDHRAVIQISVQRLGFLSSSHMYHAKSKFKKKKSPQLIFFSCNLSLLSLPQFLYSQCNRKDSYMYEGSTGQCWVAWKQPAQHHPC